MLANSKNQIYKLFFSPVYVVKRGNFGLDNIIDIRVKTNTQEGAGIKITSEQRCSALVLSLERQTWLLVF